MDFPDWVPQEAILEAERLRDAVATALLGSAIDQAAS